MSNIRGARSKLLSLKAITNNPSVDPDVVSLVETNLKKTNTIKLDGYKGFHRNRKIGNMGGVAVLVKDSVSESTIKASEGSDDNEYVVTRHSQFMVPINIITIYGEQESRAKVNIIDEKWDEIMREVIKIEERNELVVLCGDFNKMVGDIVPGNKPKISHGGYLVREFLASNKYVLLNS